MKIKISKAPPQNGLNVEGGKYETLSSDGINLLGDYHKNGGTQVSSNGELVEAERNEPIYSGSDGGNYVFGNVKNPFTGKLFKNESRQLLKDKGKAEKQIYKANEVINESEPNTKFGALDFNTGRVQLDAAQIKNSTLKKELDGLANVQETLLNMADQTGTDPKTLSNQMKKNGGKIKVRMTGIPQAKDGKSFPNTVGDFFQPNTPLFPWVTPNAPATPQAAAQAQSPVQPAQPLSSVGEWLATSPRIPGNEGYTPQGTLAPNQADPGYVRRSLEMAAQQEGIDPNLLQRLSFQESGFRPGVKGVPTKYGTAYGHVQFLPRTAKQYGITEAQLKSNKPEDVDAVSLAGAKHLRSLIDKYNGDNALALAEYNGGQGAINDVRKGLGKQNITGQDAINYWQGQNQAKGQGASNLYRNQTLNYVNNILNTPQESFYGDSGAGQNFRQNYYNGQEGTAPLPTARPIFSNETPEQAAVNQGIQPSPVSGINYRNMIPGYEDQLNPIQAGLLNDSIAARPPLPVSGQQLSGAPGGPRRNTLSPLDYLGEIGAILDTPDYVQGQQYNPTLLTPYRVSMQDQINQNTGSFNALARSMANNPEALATLQGQRYQQEQSILGNEFRQNQAIQNQVLNQNNQILNQAQLTNNQYGDIQYQRSAAALANTDANRQNALNSISAKYQANDLYNNERQAQFESQQRLSNMYGNLYQNYTFDDKGNQIFNDNGGYEFNYGGYGNQDQAAYYRYQAQQEQLKKQAKIDAARNLAQKSFGYKFQ